uniref:Uncharacterized protein n=1 Tax=Coccolithus braarudii TaxID=221442 RepID=A0A7S0L826_9EUKA
MAAAATPWYSQAVVYEFNAVGGGTDTCGQVYLRGWKKLYCADNFDNKGCSGPGFSPCADSESEWQDNCNNCEEQKQLYNGILSLMLIFVLTSTLVAVSALARCCGKCQSKSKLLILFAWASLVLLAISVIAFAARHPEAVNEDTKSALASFQCTDGPCDKLFGSLELTPPAGYLKQTQAWGAVPGWIIAVVTIPFAMAMVCFQHNFPTAVEMNEQAAYGAGAGVGAGVGGAYVGTTAGVQYGGNAPQY